MEVVHITHQFQDKTFKLCKEYEEFRKYVTGIENLEEYEDKEIVKDDYEKILLDSLFTDEKEEIIVNVEHQSGLSQEIMHRNLGYRVVLKNKKFKKTVLQYIFFTGTRIVPETYTYDDQVCYFPIFIQTCKKDGEKIFKTIKDKIKSKKKISSDDVFDLIWLPTFGKLTINDEFLEEYVEVTNQLKNNKYYEFLKVTVSGWIKRLARNEKTEKKLMEKLNMINIDSDEFKSYLATAAYERELQREQ